jgi:prepilin-type N-terminal cleavage/methylation domain-containing protein
MIQSRTLPAVRPSRISLCGPVTAGFTLIELSVVLVIIGLIVGGVLVGQDLIKQAELRKLISDVEHFKTAAYTFRAKYDCLPGDCANATQFFGVSSKGCSFGTGNSGYVTAPGGTGTCNGDGDGMVTYRNSGSNTSAFEKVLFWQHLALEGLIPGSYSGLLSGAPNAYTQFGSAVAGTDLPTTIRGAALTPGWVVTIPAAGWNACSASATLAHGIPMYAFTGASHVFWVGMTSSVFTDSQNSCPFLTGQEAKVIDIKYDDGIANTGAIQVLDIGYAAGNLCLSAGGQYVGGTTVACTMLFLW